MRVDNKLTPAEESVSIDTKKTTNVLSILSNDYLPRYIGAMSRNELADCSSSAAAGSLLLDIVIHPHLLLLLDLGLSPRCALEAARSWRAKRYTS